MRDGHERRPRAGEAARRREPKSAFLFRNLLFFNFVRLLRQTKKPITVSPPAPQIWRRATEVRDARPSVVSLPRARPRRRPVRSRRDRVRAQETRAGAERRPRTRRREVDPNRARGAMAGGRIAHARGGGGRPRVDRRARRVARDARRRRRRRRHRRGVSQLLPGDVRGRRRARLFAEAGVAGRVRSVLDAEHGSRSRRARGGLGPVVQLHVDGRAAGNARRRGRDRQAWVAVQQGARHQGAAGQSRGRRAAAETARARLRAQGFDHAQAPPRSKKRERGSHA